MKNVERTFITFLTILFTMIFSTSGVRAQGLKPDTAYVANDEENPYLLLVGQAEKAVADSNYTAAIERFNEAMALRPYDSLNFLLLTNVGELETRLGLDSAAVETYSRALDYGEKAAWVYERRANCLLRLGRDREAFNDLTTLLALDSLAENARYIHGMIALFGGQLKVAEDDFLAMQRNFPESPLTAKGLGMLYSLTERDKEAVPYLKQVITEDPAPEYYATLAGCLLALGRLPEASEIIGEGLRLAPEDPELYYYRAWLNRDLYRRDDAKRDAQKALKLGANPAKVAKLFQK